ncbi:MAG: hypothetical protein IMW89_13430 [Ktedonobacteraceae bacterium]|nr:hypothetical protein [Ktedonobacteraceae bacterium]
MMTMVWREKDGKDEPTEPLPIFPARRLVCPIESMLVTALSDEAKKHLRRCGAKIVGCGRQRKVRFPVGTVSLDTVNPSLAAWNPAQIVLPDGSVMYAYRDGPVGRLEMRPLKPLERDEKSFVESGGGPGPYGRV